MPEVQGAKRRTPRDYTLEVRENGVVIDKMTIEDPFITTTIRPRNGLRAALAALLHRPNEFVVRVDGSHETIAHVMSGADPKVEGDARG